MTASPSLGSTCDSALWFGTDDVTSHFSQLIQPSEQLSERPFYNASYCKGSGFRPMGPVVWLRLANVQPGFALSVSTCSDPKLAADTDLSVFAGPCDELVQIACNGDSHRPAAQCQLGYSSISELPITRERYYIVIGGRQGESLSPVLLTAAYDSPPPPPSTMYSVSDTPRHGVSPQVVTLQWPAGTIAQRYRLVQAGSASLFWVTTWKFFSNAECTAQVFPDAAHDSSHFGCCGTGCIAGVETGACCCDHLYRSQPCASEECWVEVDFGAALKLPCMQYAASRGSGSGVTLQIWSEGRAEWLDPGVSTLEVVLEPLEEHSLPVCAGDTGQRDYGIGALEPAPLDVVAQ